jgi:steroid delta-isomerase-like uncharacterized protein
MFSYFPNPIHGTVTMTTDTLSTVAEANAALGQAFFAEQDRVRGGPTGALCAAAYTVTIGSNPPMDRAGHESFAVGFYAGFPDAMHEIDDVVATSDRAFVRAILHGTHTGSFFGIPATGKTIRVPLHGVFHVRDGLVEKLVAVFDEAGLLRQIGVMPSH